MQSFIWVLVTTMVAAFIGGMTNYLAIKMLFHPRGKWTIGKWRVPFTPGLIPKRKDEIAASLGRIVGQYLVTSEGLISVLRSENLQKKWTAKLRYELIERPTFELTVKQLLIRFIGQQNVERIINGLSEKSKDWLQSAFYTWWNAKKLDERPIGEVLPSLSGDKADEMISYAAGWLLKQAGEELASPHSEQLIESMLSDLFDRSGWFGAFAGLMTDTRKLALRIQDVLAVQIQSEEVERAVRERMLSQWEEWNRSTLSELIAPIAGEEGKGWVYDQLSSLMQADQWFEKVMSTKLEALFPNGKQWLDARLSDFSRWTLMLASKEVEQLVQAIDLPNLVQQQVSRFPVERIEQIVLGVSGKEFRAITWLGALLGGFIGFFQAIVYLNVIR